MSTQPQSVPTHFFTKEKNIKFSIQVDCKIELVNDNFMEIIERGERRPYDRAIFSKNGGLDIKDSLDKIQIDCIIDEINKITQRDFHYCKKNDIVNASGHIVNDYCADNNEELIKRGWPVELEDLLDEITHILCNVSKVDKAKIKFKEDGKSKEKLTYTIIGEHNNFQGSLAVTFQSQIASNGAQKETILTVTVLERREKS